MHRAAGVSTGCPLPDRSHSNSTLPRLAALVATALGLIGHSARAASPDLVGAAGRGDLAAVRVQLASGADVNMRGTFGSYHVYTPLQAATLEGRLDVVRALLAAHADVNALQKNPDDSPKQGTTALMLASTNGHLEVARELLAAKSDVNVGNGMGETALLLAVQRGNPGMVKLLLESRADPSPYWKGGGGRSALLLAVMAGQLQIARTLVEAGADTNAATSYGETALRLAASGKSPAHLELVRAMLATPLNLEAGVPPNYKAEPPRGCPGTNSASAQEVSVCGTRVPAEGTALGLAVRYGSTEIVQALIGAKANVNARQTGWQTPLIIATAQDRADVVRLLIAAGADVSAKDNNGRSALQVASQSSNRTVLELLDSAVAAGR